jgi:hypothetical protein
VTGGAWFKTESSPPTGPEHMVQPTLEENGSRRQSIHKERAIIRLRKRQVGVSQRRLYPTIAEKSSPIKGKARIETTAMDNGRRSIPTWNGHRDAERYDGVVVCRRSRLGGGVASRRF